MNNANRGKEKTKKQNRRFGNDEMKTRIRIYRSYYSDSLVVRIGNGMDYANWWKLADYEVEEKDNIFIYPEIELGVKVTLNEPLIKNKQNKRGGNKTK